MEALSKFLLITIIIFFVCNIIFIIIKYLLLTTLEENEDFDRYYKTITKNYLKYMEKKYPDEETFSQTLKTFEEKENETCKYIKEEKCLEKKKLESEIYDHYIKFKNT